MSDEKERRVRKRFLALLATLVLLAIALFVAAVAAISTASPPPPLTTILAAPPDPSSSSAATFTYTNIAPVTAFECRLDAASFTACGATRPSTTSYSDLGPGEHVFEVRAVANGMAGSQAVHRWSVVVPPGGVGAAGEGGSSGDGTEAVGGGSGGSGSGSGDQGSSSKGTGSAEGGSGGRSEGDDAESSSESGSGDAPSSEPAPFFVSGDVPSSKPLYPGGPARSIPLRLRNPNGSAIHVTEVAVALDAPRLPPGCRASWFQITQSNASDAKTLTVTAGGSVTLPAQGVSAPTIRMVDSGNQDACKGATLRLTYSGKARS